MSIKFVFDIDGYPNQTQRVVIDNKTYDFTFVYNEYGDSWRLFIAEPGAEPLCSFKMTSMNLPLLPYQYNLTIPQGNLLCGGVIDITVRLEKDNIGIGKSAYMFYLS